MLQGFCGDRGHLEVSREQGWSWEQALVLEPEGAEGWMRVGL